MTNYNDLEIAYKQNMFASEGQKKQTLVDLYQTLDDLAITDDSEKNLYHLAARFLDYEAISYLFEQGIKPRADEYNNTPLHALARTPYGNEVTNYTVMADAIYHTAKALLNAGVNPKKKNDDGEISYLQAGTSAMYPFLQAMAEANLKMDGIIKEGKNIILLLLDNLYHRKNIKGEKENVYHTVKILIESGSVDPDDKDIFNHDALYYAQRCEANEIVALITGDETATQTGGMTLTRAILNNSLEAVQAILQNGANPDEIEEQDRTPLMWVCEYPKPEIVKLLLQHKANPNYTAGETGNTAIYYLLSKSVQHVNGSPQELRKVYTTILRALFDAGLDLDAPIDKEGNTALCYVALMDYFCDQNNTIAEELLEAGANPNKANLQGLTPLMIFARKGDEQEHAIAELLLDNGADPALVDKDSNTALMYAAGNYKKASGKKIAELILDSGYKDIERANNKGQTAMDIAVSNENESLVKLLITSM